jgi:hypothetical protein
MYSNRFLEVVIFSFGFISACSDTIEIENLDYTYIKERIGGLEYAYGESLLSKLDTLKRLPSRKVENLLKEAIANPKDNKQLGESIFYAGILELKRLRKTISSVVSSDLYVTLNQYFYYCKINVDKEKNLKYLKFYCDISGMDPKDKDIPPLIHGAMYRSICLLGWIFDSQSLEYLKSLDTSNMDGALGEDYLDSVDRVEFFLSKIGK